MTLATRRSTAAAACVQSNNMNEHTSSIGKKRKWDEIKPEAASEDTEQTSFPRDKSETGSESPDTMSPSRPSSDDLLSEESNDSDGSDTPRHGKGNRRKHRHRTTPYQLEVLEDVYKTEKLPSHELRETLAQQLVMTPRQVQVWFQNKRAKEKRLLKRGSTLADQVCRPRFKPDSALKFKHVAPQRDQRARAEFMRDGPLLPPFEAIQTRDELDFMPPSNRSGAMLLPFSPPSPPRIKPAIPVAVPSQYHSGPDSPRQSGGHPMYQESNGYSTAKQSGPSFSMPRALPSHHNISSTGPERSPKGLDFLRGSHLPQQYQHHQYQQHQHHQQQPQNGCFADFFLEQRSVHSPHVTKHVPTSTPFGYMTNHGDELDSRGSDPIMAQTVQLPPLRALSMSLQPLGSSSRHF